MILNVNEKTQNSSAGLNRFRLHSYLSNGCGPKHLVVDCLLQVRQLGLANMIFVSTAIELG